MSVPVRAHDRAPTSARPPRRERRPGVAAAGHPTAGHTGSGHTGSGHTGSGHTGSDRPERTRHRDGARRDAPRRDARSGGRPSGQRPDGGRSDAGRLDLDAAAARTAATVAQRLAATPDPDFAALGVPPVVVSALTRAGLLRPFPIQTAAVPDALAGRDVLGRGRTGSGKTLAFAIPTVARLASGGRTRRPGHPRALILVPTRELANQVAETLTPLATSLGLRTSIVYGGVSQGRQVRELSAGVDVLIACPGRLEDLIAQGHLALSEVEVTVLDEADHMADLGFLPAVKRLLDATPAGGQRLLFSATLDGDIDVLVRRYLVDPAVHAVDAVDTPVSTMTHHVLVVPGAEKAALVAALAGGQGRTLLFLRTKHAARKLASQLSVAGVPAVDLHGNLAQAARERNLAAFSTGSVRVLVATDIAARGIHVDDIALVVHVDPPAEEKAYLHRSGRTARAGADGIVVTLATPDQLGDVTRLTRKAGIAPTRTDATAGSAIVAQLVGPPAPLVPWTPPPATPARGSGGARSGGARGARTGGAPGGARGYGRSGPRTETQDRSGAPARGRRPGAPAGVGRGRPDRASGPAVPLYSTSSAAQPAAAATPRRGPRRAERVEG